VAQPKLPHFLASNARDFGARLGRRAKRLKLPAQIKAVERNLDGLFLLRFFLLRFFLGAETGWYPRDGDCSETLEKLRRIFFVIVPGAKLTGQWRR
jgi:hypothetical protein